MPDRADEVTATSSVKVVVTGAYGAGKTTLVRSLSEINVLTQERSVTSAGGDAPDTIAMDFGRLTVGDGLSLHLFGTPTRDRFDFMWDVVKDGMVGFIVLVDDSRADSLPEAVGVLNWFRERANVPYVVAVNKVAPANAERSIRRARHVLRIPDHVRVCAVDVRQRASSKQLLLQLLHAATEDADGVHDEDVEQARAG